MYYCNKWELLSRAQRRNYYCPSNESLRSAAPAPKEGNITTGLSVKQISHYSQKPTFPLLDNGTMYEINNGTQKAKSSSPTKENSSIGWNNIKTNSSKGWNAFSSNTKLYSETKKTSLDVDSRMRNAFGTTGATHEDEVEIEENIDFLHWERLNMETIKSQIGKHFMALGNFDNETSDDIVKTMASIFGRMIGWEKEGELVRYC